MLVITRPKSELGYFQCRVKTVQTPISLCVFINLEIIVMRSETNHEVVTTITLDQMAG